MKYFGVTATIYLNVINIVFLHTLYIAGTVSNSNYCTGVTCIIVLPVPCMGSLISLVLC